MVHIIYFHNLLAIKEQFRNNECYMGPFHVNKTVGRHLGRHLVAYKLSNDEIARII